MKQLCAATHESERHFSDMPRQPDDVRSPGDTVAKVVLHRWSKFLRAVGVVFV